MHVSIRDPTAHAAGRVIVMLLLCRHAGPMAPHRSGRGDLFPSPPPLRPCTHGCHARPLHALDRSS